MMPENAEFITDEEIEVAEQMNAFQKVRLGFIMDGIRYHIVMTDPKKQGIWVVRLDDEQKGA